MYTIVAIDDDPTTLLIFRHMLGSRYHLETATNAHDGIELGCQLHPDLFIIDLHLPHVNGFEAIEIIQTTEGIHDTPVLIVTANGSLAARQNLLAAGIDQILLKPFTPQSLLDAVHSAILRYAAAG
jgi:CheY-like chemotaxis protein